MGATQASLMLMSARMLLLQQATQSSGDLPVGIRMLFMDVRGASAKKMATSSCKTKEMASAMGIGITSAFAKKKQGADPTANPSTDSRPEQIPRPLRGRLPPMSPACKRIDPGGAGLTITLTAVCAGPLYMPR